MKKSGKIILFIIICGAILFAFTIIKAETGKSVLWIGSLAIIITYFGLFNHGNATKKK